jgi:hypothetical protein
MFVIMQLENIILLSALLARSMPKIVRFLELIGLYVPLWIWKMLFIEMRAFSKVICL